jgi:hypothetical protein
MEQSQGDMSLKNPVTPPGIDPGTVQLVVQSLNRYASPGPDDLELYKTSRPAMGPPSLPLNGYQGLFPQGWTGQGMKLTSHLQPRTMLRREAITLLLLYAFIPCTGSLTSLLFYNKIIQLIMVSFVTSDQFCFLINPSFISEHPSQV